MGVENEMGNDQILIDLSLAHNEENAAEAYCEYLFTCDPRDLDEEIFVNDKKYRIYTEVSPNFCASKQ